ncbi:hypothetical protein [Candidatus Nitrosocosmicus arcticus]|uniref:Uncharacterized protein n=1 Tax=Candidatus Nitrosocosmicus arcticus TaxID=2035267 RepID=A0A557SXP1_9ARCH|nr:hypothetical protein [Candidatus Nitrosocosmicus arcticus]TVP41376.1 hypothetical protein NARC_30090 [Candidatus Nitrosocosmicus arcticus]
MGFGYNNNNIYTDCCVYKRNNQIFFKRQTEQKDNELKEHRQILKTDLSNLLEDLKIKKKNIEGMSQWRQEIELFPIKIKLHEDLKKHLKKEKLEDSEVDLLEDIITLQHQIDAHNEKTTKFRNGLRLFVEKKFIENNIIPSEEPLRGFYYNDDYEGLMNIQFSSIVQCIKENSSLNELMENMRLPFKRNDDGYITMAGKLVGNIEELNTEKMKNILKEIPFDNNIINSLTTFYNEVSNIQEKSDKIEEELNKIVQELERNHYKEKANCCPKKFIFF